MCCGHRICRRATRSAAAKRSRWRHRTSPSDFDQVRDSPAVPLLCPGLVVIKRAEFSYAHPTQFICSLPIKIIIQLCCCWTATRKMWICGWYNGLQCRRWCRQNHNRIRNPNRTWIRPVMILCSLYCHGDGWWLVGSYVTFGYYGGWEVRVGLLTSRSLVPQSNLCFIRLHILVYIFYCLLAVT